MYRKCQYCGSYAVPRGGTGADFCLDCYKGNDYVVYTAE